MLRSHYMSSLDEKMIASSFWSHSLDYHRQLVAVFDCQRQLICSKFPPCVWVVWSAGTVVHPVVFLTPKSLDD